MKTITDRNKWRSLEERELELALPWMRIQSKYRRVTYFCLLSISAGLTLAIILICLIGRFWNDMLQFSLWLLIPLILLIGLSLHSLIKENRKFSQFKNGNVKVTDASIVKKEIRTKHYGPYCYISVKGLYEEDKSVIKDFEISKQIYTRVSVGDDGWIIRYSTNEDNKNTDMDFVPKEYY